MALGALLMGSDGVQEELYYRPRMPRVKALPT